MAVNDYKRHIQVLKMEQKIGRIKRELETVDYGDGCPLHGENDCAEVRKAYDRGFVNGAYEALTLFKLIEDDTPQTSGVIWTEDAIKNEPKSYTTSASTADISEAVIIDMVLNECKTLHNGCDNCNINCAWRE